MQNILEDGSIQIYADPRYLHITCGTAATIKGG